MTDTDDTIASARAAYERITGARYAVTPTRPRPRAGGLRKRIARIAIADAAILVAAFVIGLIVPLGIFGALAVMALLIATTIALAILPTETAPAPERLRQSDLKSLPAQTSRWLDAQRPALPAPAVMVADRIGVRLDTLGVQLATLDDESPAAGDIRRLIGEQLPDFLRDYQRVPRNLRGQPRNGTTPDRQLIDGLEVIDREIGQLSEHLAQGDLDSLATRSRFLEIKYSGE